MSNKQGNDSIGFSAAVNLRWSRSHRIFVFPRWVPRVIPCDLTQQTLLRMANVNSDIMKVSRIGWSSRLPIPLSTTLPPPFSIRTRLGSLEPPSREGNTSPVGPPDVLPPFPPLLCYSRGTDLYRRFRTRCESHIPAVADPGLLFPEPFPQTRTPAPGPVQSPWTSVPYDFIQSHLRPPMTPAAKRKADITTGPPGPPPLPYIYPRFHWWRDQDPRTVDNAMNSESTDRRERERGRPEETSAPMQTVQSGWDCEIKLSMASVHMPCATTTEGTAKYWKHVLGKEQCDLIMTRTLSYLLCTIP